MTRIPTPTSDEAKRILSRAGNRELVERLETRLAGPDLDDHLIRAAMEERGRPVQDDYREFLQFAQDPRVRFLVEGS